MTATNRRSYKRYSLSKKLKEENRSNDYLEMMLTNLTIEEVIGLKLESTFKSLGIDLYGFPLYHAIPSIAKDALVKFVLSYTGSRTETRRILGISIQKLKSIIDKGNF